MEFSEYQKKALESDRASNSPYVSESIQKIVPMLGLAGEAGELLSEYKKLLRDNEAHEFFPERIEDELGDLLWYLSNVASKFKLDLNIIAEKNLTKVHERFVRDYPRKPYDFDSSYPELERFPRQFEIEIKQVVKGDMIKVQVFYEGKQIGNDLTDNARDPDGYRFHDVFHFAYAAILGWSPVTRMFLRRKRKSDSKTDEVEDGGRAIAIEEGISALVFPYAIKHHFYGEVHEIDNELLKNIRLLTFPTEARACTTGDWENAILSGYKVWRQVRDNEGGIVVGDLDGQTLAYKHAQKI